MRRGAWRRAIKLEPVFWTVLEGEADEAGLRLTDHVRVILDGLEAGANATAALRARAVAGLLARLDGARAQAALWTPSYVLQACPAPGFVIASGGALIAHNAAFVALVRRAAGATGEAAVAGVRMRLDVPIAGLVEALGAAHPRPLECGFVLSAGDRALPGRVRVCLAAAPRGRWHVLGFVLGLDGRAG